MLPICMRATLAQQLPASAEIPTRRTVTNVRTYETPLPRGEGLRFNGAVQSREREKTGKSPNCLLRACSARCGDGGDVTELEKTNVTQENNMRNTAIAHRFSGGGQLCLVAADRLGGEGR